MDRLSKERRSRNMASIRSKDMRPEKLVRSLLHRLGYRFRIHRKDLPGTPDIVLPAYKTVVFVHGCFWHQHPEPSCINSRLPKSNIEYWHAKFQRNVNRDRKVLDDLIGLGWRVIIVWECETKNIDRLARRLDESIQDKKA